MRPNGDTQSTKRGNLGKDEYRNDGTDKETKGGRGGNAGKPVYEMTVHVPG